jgi:hypothetical protein
MDCPAHTSSSRRRVLRKVLPSALAIAAICSSQANPLMTPTPNQPPHASWNSPSEEEAQRINAVLTTYARSVSQGNAQLFESQLLDLKIPFAGVWGEMAASANLATIQDYAGFRKSIFESGKTFKQRFSNIKIEQIGPVAQVSLDYETALKESDYDRKGWKVIQLLKVEGQWKIASEFFTGYTPR